MTDEPAGNINLEPDEPPKSGEWVDAEEFLADPTEDEVREGNLLGIAIDTDDDTDNGLS